MLSLSLPEFVGAMVLTGFMGEAVGTMIGEASSSDPCGPPVAALCRGETSCGSSGVGSSRAVTIGINEERRFSASAENADDATIDARPLLDP